MIFADNSPNQADCPECGGSDEEFEKQLQETWQQLDCDEQAIADFCEETR